jgi:hypothetical protein
MNSLPRISHHLFVEAVGHEGASAKASDVSDPSHVSNIRADKNVRGLATAIPLELLDSSQLKPADPTRHLRAPKPAG